MKLREAEILIINKDVQLEIIKNAESKIKIRNDSIKSIKESEGNDPVEKAMGEVDIRIIEFAIKEWEALIVVASNRISEIEAKFK